MLNLTPHHRIHIPNSLAIVAVLLLLIVSAANFESVRDTISPDPENTISTHAEGAARDNGINATTKKSRGLNLGLLLFRRG